MDRLLGQHSHNTRDFPPLVFVVARVGGAERPVGRHVHAGIEFLTAIEFIEDVLGADAASLCGRVIPGAAALRSQRTRPSG